MAENIMNFNKLKFKNLVSFVVFIEALFPILFYVTNSSFFLYLPLFFIFINIVFINRLTGLMLSYILSIGIVFLTLIFFLVMDNYPFEISFFSGLILFLWNITLAILLVNIGVGRFLIGIIFSFFSIYVFFLGAINGFDPDFGNNIFLEASRNYVSAVCIVYYICYISLCFYDKEKINIFNALMLVIVCVLLFGRSGIALSIMLFAYTLFYNYGIKLLFLFLIFMIGLLTPIIYFAMNYTNFSDGLETPRNSMRYEYLNNMSSWDILFGRNFYQCCKTIVAYGPNPHNSFIALHSLFGIFGIVISLVPILFSIYARKYQLTFLILIVYIRYFYDVLGLFYVLDFVIFVIFIMCFKGLKNKKGVYL